MSKWKLYRPTDCLYHKKKIGCENSDAHTSNGHRIRVCIPSKCLSFKFRRK